MAGKPVACKKCGRAFNIPHASTATATGVAPSPGGASSAGGAASKAGAAAQADDAGWEFVDENESADANAPLNAAEAVKSAKPAPAAASASFSSLEMEAKPAPAAPVYIPPPSPAPTGGIRSAPAASGSSKSFGRKPAILVAVILLGSGVLAGVIVAGVVVLRSVNTSGLGVSLRGAAGASPDWPEPPSMAFAPEWPTNDDLGLVGTEVYNTNSYRLPTSARGRPMQTQLFWKPDGSPAGGFPIVGNSDDHQPANAHLYVPFLESRSRSFGKVNGIPFVRILTWGKKSNGKERRFIYYVGLDGDNVLWLAMSLGDPGSPGSITPEDADWVLRTVRRDSPTPPPPGAVNLGSNLSADFSDNTFARGLILGGADPTLRPASIPIPKPPPDIGPDPALLAKAPKWDSDPNDPALRGVRYYPPGTDGYTIPGPFTPPGTTNLGEVQIARFPIPFGSPRSGFPIVHKRSEANPNTGTPHYTLPQADGYSSETTGVIGGVPFVRVILTVKKPDGRVRRYLTYVGLDRQYVIVMEVSLHTDNSMPIPEEYADKVIRLFRSPKAPINSDQTASTPGSFSNSTPVATPTSATPSPSSPANSVITWQDTDGILGDRSMTILVGDFTLGAPKNASRIADEGDARLGQTAWNIPSRLGERMRVFVDPKAAMEDHWLKPAASAPASLTALDKETSRYQLGEIKVTRTVTREDKETLPTRAIVHALYCFEFEKKTFTMSVRCTRAQLEEADTFARTAYHRGAGVADRNGASSGRIRDSADDESWRPNNKTNWSRPLENSPDLVETRGHGCVLVRLPKGVKLIDTGEDKENAVAWQFTDDAGVTSRITITSRERHNFNTQAFATITNYPGRDSDFAVKRPTDSSTTYGRIDDIAFVRIQLPPANDKSGATIHYVGVRDGEAIILSLTDIRGDVDAHPLDRAVRSLQRNPFAADGVTQKPWNANNAPIWDLPAKAREKLTQTVNANNGFTLRLPAAATKATTSDSMSRAWEFKDDDGNNVTVTVRVRPRLNGVTGDFPIVATTNDEDPKRSDYTFHLKGKHTRTYGVVNDIPCARVFSHLPAAANGGTPKNELTYVGIYLDGVISVRVSPVPTNGHPALFDNICRTIERKQQ